MKKLLAKIRKILKDRRIRQLLTRIVSVTAAIVVFVTTYALVLPAITMETEAQCGIPAHQHDDSCYEEILTCEIPESEGHHHTEDCYTTKQELDCKVEEHQHGADCYDADGNLVCGLTEHTHSVDNGCYEEVRELTCEIPESDGHQHDSSCYEKVLTCGKEVHTHSAECYSDSTTADTEDAAVEISSGGGTSAAAASTGNAEAGVDNAASGTGTAESAGKALTIVDNAEAGITEDGHYVPELAPINFSMVLDNHTGIYYHAVEDGEVIEDSTALTYDKWNRVKDNTELGTADLLRVYLAYTIPAGALNPTNPVARYRLPGNLHLSDAQVKAISETVNGIASQYVNMDTLEILDTEKYYAYLGIEAVEGTRTPIDDPDKYLADISRKTGTTASEYICATVRVENVYDEQSGELTAQDLVFTWTPYTIEKNQHEYDSTGNPTKAGEEISGWFSLDFNLSQVDFPDPDITTFERKIENETEIDQAVENHNVEEQTADAGENTAAVETVEHREQTADIIFVEEGRDENNQKIQEISTTLTVVEESVIDTHGVDDQSEEQENAEDTISDGEAVDGTEESDESVTGETADAATTGETSASTEEDNKDLADTEASTVIMPAMSFNDSITVRTGKPADVEENAGGTVANAADALPEKAEVTVRVEADEGTFPAGTTMVLKVVEQDVIDELANTLTETAEAPSLTDDEGKENEKNEKGDEKREEVDLPNKANLKTYGFQAVDITFIDSEGNEIEPAKPVRVAMTSETVEQARKEAETSAVTDPVVVHVDDDGNAEKMDLLDPDQIEPAQGKTEEKLQEDESRDTGREEHAENAGNIVKEETDEEDSEKTDTGVPSENTDGQSSVVDAQESSSTLDAVQSITETQGQAVDDLVEEKLEFNTDSFSVYVIVYTVELYTNIISDSGETYRITVTYDESSGIPQNADLKVKEIKENDVGYENYYAEAVKTASGSLDMLDEGESHSADSDKKNNENNELGSNNGANSNVYARFFDIEIWSAGQKVEPVGDVFVSIRLLDVPENEDKRVIKIVHFDKDNPEIIPHTVNEPVLDAEKRDDDKNDSHPGSPENAATRNTTEYNKHLETGSSEDEGVTEFNFTTNSFSVYSVVAYTVDFFWEVNGKVYEFKLPGGGFVSLEKLVEVLGIAKSKPYGDSGNEIRNNDEKQGEITLTLDGVQVSEETKKFVADVKNVEFSNPDLVWVKKIETESSVGELKEVNKLEVQHSADLTEDQINEINSQKVEAGDWALISVKTFTSEEKLIVTMKNGEQFEVKVTDPISDTPPNNMQTLTTQDTYAKGIKMWLFDYDDDHSLDNLNNKANTNNNKTDGINNYSDFKFLGWGAGNSGATYESGASTGFGINDFTGLDEGNTNRIRALQGIVKNTLVDGYPVLNDSHKTNGVNQSLAYLFNPNISTTDRTVYGGSDGEVTGLFEYKNGYYIYDSDEHYAQLGGTNNTQFTVFTSTLAQTNKTGGQHNPARAVGFFPFDTYEHAYYTKYGNNYNYGHDGYRTLYLNPDGGPYNNERCGLNHHLGVGMEMNFIIPEGGKIDDVPIQFNFSGDDDMWVFIDDQLVLDIGGLHQPVDGTIDFSTGKATITGKATVANHTDNTGSAAIATVSGANDPRGNNFSFYPAIGLTGGDGKVHTMKVFYLERGGCDSNCMISFNLPLVLVKKNSDLIKIGENANALQGAEFTVFEDRACRTPLTVGGKSVKAVSDASGNIVLKNIPYNENELNTKVYYMKETAVPNEYVEDPTVYVLHYDAASDRVRIKKLKIDGTEEDSYVSTITNQKMSIVVKKEWLDEDGQVMDPAPSTPVTFHIRRYKTYTPVVNTTNMREVSFSFQKFGSVHNQWPKVTTAVNARPGDTVTVTIRDTDNNWASFKNGGNSDATFTATNGVATFDIAMRAGKDSWQFESHNYNVYANNTATISAVNKTLEEETQQAGIPVTVRDASFENTLTLPISGQWTQTVSGLPAQEIKSDGIHYYYTYYVEEEIPEGYRVIYYDKDGNEIQDPSTLKTDVPGTQQRIGNRKYPHADIPAQKYWGDFEGDEYDWVATLQLDYREIPVPLGDVNPNDCSWADYKPGDSRYCKQISKAVPETTFEDLPMYVMKNDGQVYRREYTIIETAYTVWRTHNGTRVELIKYQKEPYIMVPSDAYKYTPWYDHDAGEDDDYDDEVYPGAEDYNIVVHNLRENRNIQKDIDLTVEKEWSNQQYYEDSNAKAKFQLKRYILTEYRNYEETEYANRPKVELHLNDGTRDIEILRVPNGVPMSIHGYLKPGESGTISFSNGISYNADNQTSEPKAFDIRFTADSNSPTITLIGGAQYVVGGASGFRFKEWAGSSQTEELDSSFCIEFELDKDNHWRQTFPEPSSSDPGHHDNTTILPAVEVSILDASENTANTYVYRYFIEEVECTPESFNATFTNGTGNELLGDKDHQVYFDTTIKATNRPTGLDVLKIDVNNPDRKLPGAKFQLKKLDGDTPTPAIGGTYSGAIIPPVSDATDSNGKQTFKPDNGLASGYYELTELKAPDGYVITADSTIYIKVEELGVIKLLKRDASGTVLWDEAAEEGELVGSASVSTSTTAADGKTITFTVRNEPGVELPAAGGPGTKLIYLLGGLLAVVSLLLLYQRKCGMA